MDIKKLAHRLSANVEDVRQYPPKPNPRSGYPRFYDPARARYADPFPDAIAGLIKLGMRAKRNREGSDFTPEEEAALIKGIGPVY